MGGRVILVEPWGELQLVCVSGRILLNFLGNDFCLVFYKLDINIGL